METKDKEIINFNIDFNDGTLRVSLVGDLGHQNVVDLREKLDTQIRELKPSCVVLDFSQVNFMDASGLGFILGRAQLLGDLGGKLIIEKSNKSISRLISLAGIEKINNVKVNEN